MPTRQFIGKTVDEATDLALETLDLKREEVEIVVVNPGRSGILGFGGEPAEIHVTPLEDVDAEILNAGEPPSGQPSESEQEGQPGPSRGGQSDDRGRRGRGGRGRRGRGRGESRSRFGDAPVDAPPAMRDEALPADEHEASPDTDAEPPHDERDDRQDDRPIEEAEESRPKRREQRVHTPGPDPEVEPVAAEVLDYFLSVMDVSVATYVSEDSDDCDVAFEIEGEDSGLLIGRRGETLQALQFLVNVVINKKMDRPAYITIDVEGYRERQQDALRDSAERAAESALSSGESQTLQPMNASDRRIIHLTLADHPDVETQSRGQGDQRRVVVLLKA